jgi:hypothetical protein
MPHPVLLLAHYNNLSTTLYRLTHQIESISLMRQRFLANPFGDRPVIYRVIPEKLHTEQPLSNRFQ